MSQPYTDRDTKLILINSAHYSLEDNVVNSQKNFNSKAARLFLAAYFT